MINEFTQKMLNNLRTPLNSQKSFINKDIV